MPHHAVTTATALGPQIIQLRSETEAQRQLPKSIISALVESNLFRQVITTDIGGLELDPVVSLEVYEALAKSEASVGWAVWNSSLPCLLSRFLSDSVRKEIFGDPTLTYTSSTRPTGRASMENDSFRISGHWSLVSGCMHADWIGFMCMVEKDGEIQMAEQGGPQMLMAFIPSGSYEIIDTWHVGGLRGTGSHDITVDDLMVPMGKTFSPMGPSQLDRPIGRIPIGCTMSAGHAAICLGIAQAALESVIDLARSKITVDPVPGLPDRASNQFLVAEAATKIAALRAHLHLTLGSLWKICQSGSEWTPDDLAQVWSAAVTTGRECRSLVSALYEVAGSPALYQDFSLERCHRDIHAAMQHVVIQRLWLEEAGKVKFGMDPTNPLFAW